MKIKIALLGFALLCIASTNIPSPIDLIGATNGGSASTNVPIHMLPVVQQPQNQFSQWLVMVIPILVPLLIDYMKKSIPNLPSWALPALAPVLGALADLVFQAAGVQTGGTIKGALLGSAGVGLRELANQITQTVKPQASPTPPPKPDAGQPPANTPK